MTQHPPQTFFAANLPSNLQNTRIQTRGPNAGGGGYFHDTTFRTQPPQHIFVFILFE